MYTTYPQHISFYFCFQHLQFNLTRQKTLKQSGQRQNYKCLLKYLFVDIGVFVMYFSSSSRLHAH